MSIPKKPNKLILSFKKKITKDVIYDSDIVGKIINLFMKKGKKTKSQNIVYTAINDSVAQIKKNYKDSNKLLDMDIINKVIKNLQLTESLRSRRYGSNQYYIPYDISDIKSINMAIKRIKIAAVHISKSRKKTITQALSSIIVDTYHNTGYAVEEKIKFFKKIKEGRVHAHLVGVIK